MPKILVTYATKCGSTIEVAQAIGQALSEKGSTVNVLPVRQARDLSPYRAVVVGSAIRMGAWLPEAVNFVKEHKEQLSRLPRAYFLVSGYLQDDTPEMRQTVNAYLDPVRAILPADDVALFAGKIDIRTMSFIDRTLTKAMKTPEGDWRDWDAIRAWAAGLAL